MPYALLPQGESLYYQVIGQGAPLILVHGNLCAGAHFAPFLPYLQRGSPVIFLTCAEQEKAATIRRYIALMTFQRTCMRYCGI